MSSEVYSSAVWAGTPRAARPGIDADARGVEALVALVLGGNAGLEGHAVRLGEGVAMAVLGEVEPLLFSERCLEVPRSAADTDAGPGVRHSRGCGRGQPRRRSDPRCR